MCVLFPLNSSFKYLPGQCARHILFGGFSFINGNLSKTFPLCQFILFLFFFFYFNQIVDIYEKGELSEFSAYICAFRHRTSAFGFKLNYVQKEEKKQTKDKSKMDTQRLRKKWFRTYFFFSFGLSLPVCNSHLFTIKPNVNEL